MLRTSPFHRHQQLRASADQMEEIMLEKWDGCLDQENSVTDFFPWQRCFSNSGWTYTQKIRFLGESCCMFVCCPLNSSLIRFHPCIYPKSVWHMDALDSHFYDVWLCSGAHLKCRSSKWRSPCVFFVYTWISHVWLVYNNWVPTFTRTTITIMA